MHAMKRILVMLGLLLVLPHASKADGLGLLDEEGKPCLIAELAREKGAALLVLKAFPGAMEGAARSLSQLPPSIGRRIPIRLLFAGCPLRRVRRWVAQRRYEGRWLCDPENRVMEGLSVRSLPSWLLLDREGRIVARASHLAPRALARLLREQMGKISSP